MARWTRSSLLVIASFCLAACGGSPAAPTPTPSTGVFDAAAETAVNAMVMPALAQAPTPGLTLTSSLPVAPVLLFPCPDGGNITTTVSMPALTGDATEGPFIFTSRTEYNDCRSQNVTMRGAPALVHTNELRSAGPISSAPVLTATRRTTGGLAIVANGVESLIRMDCTSVMVMQMGQLGSMPLPQITWTGTIVWESPSGTVVRTTACGPAR